jgi:hypothetical protein
MSNRLQTLLAVSAVVVVAQFIAGCEKAGTSSSQPPAQQATVQTTPNQEREKFPEHPGQMSHSRVSGDPALLKSFNVGLKKIEAVDKLEDAFIACHGCAQLEGGTPPAQLDYYYPTEHKMKPQKFQDAMRAVKAANADGKIVLLEPDQNLEYMPQPACPPSPPAPLCYSAPWCTSTGQCDKDRNASGCQVCQ